MKKSAPSILFLIFLCLSVKVTAISSTSCPVDLSYVPRIPWSTASCNSFPNSTSSSSQNLPDSGNSNSNSNSASGNGSCCQNILSLFGIALANRLKETSQFQLPNLATSVSCIQEFQSQLNALPLPPNLTSLCFDPMQFVISPNVCASIQTLQEWRTKLGSSTALDSDCSEDLNNPSYCSSCISAGFQVQSELMSIDRNRSNALNCLYFTILYSAGIVNKVGTQDYGTISCIFALPMSPQTISSRKNHLSLILGLTLGSAALLVLSLILGFYFWRVKRLKSRNWNDPSSEFDETGTRPNVRPNTGLSWFKFHELQNATDDFSEMNFIGKGGFGIVYKGTLPDGNVVAIKKIIDSEQSSPVFELPKYSIFPSIGRTQTPQSSVQWAAHLFIQVRTKKKIPKKPSHLSRINPKPTNGPSK